MNRHTVIHSNHLPLLYYKTLPKLWEKLLRWLDLLDDFLIDVQYRPDKHSVLPDVLSQQPSPPTDVHPCGDACLSSMVL